MSYKIEFEERPAYLYAKVTGRNESSAVAEYMRAIVAECTERDCFRVLIDEQLSGPRLSVEEVFTVASEGAMEALGIFEAIAYVDAQMGEMAYFGETVVVNRGMPVRAFLDVEEAAQWLLDVADNPDDPLIIYGTGRPGDDASES